MGKEKGQREKISKKRKKMETPLLGRNQNKKIAPRKLIGVLIILAGIGVFCYPLCVQAYNAYEQKKMIEELRENIAAEQDAMASDEGEIVIRTESPAQPDGKKTSKELKHPEGTGISEGIGFPGEAEATDGTEDTDGAGLLTGTEFPVAAEPDQIGTALDGGQENQDGGLENAFGEDPEESAQEEGTRSDRLTGKKVIGLIEIEAISLIYPIVEGAETEDIGVAIGHMSDTAELGAIGNCALAGHRGGYSGPYFKKLDELKEGDKVVITNVKGKEFVYKVTESMVVEPTDVWVTEDTEEGKALLTLITCEENGDKRLVVRSEMAP